MGIIRENINFERGNPQKALNLGFLKSLEKQGVRLFFDWGTPEEQEKTREKTLENMGEIEEFFSLLKKNGVDPKDMEISSHDCIEINNYQVLDGNHVIHQCLTEEQALGLIEECKKRSINRYDGNFNISRGKSNIYFTKYLKEWLKNL